MNILHLTVWSSRARLTSYVVLLCKKDPSTVCFLSLVRESWGWSKFQSSLRFPKVARQHRLKIHFEKNSCQNLSQKMFTFFQSIYQIYAFFGPLFLLPKAPFGPHFTQNQVPILKNWGPLPMWERWHWYWVYSRILFLHFCILILLYMSTSCRGPWRKAFSAKVPSFVVLSRIPVSFRCFLNFCIFRFFVPFVHGARDCLLLWTPFKKKTSYLNPT